MTALKWWQLLTNFINKELAICIVTKCHSSIVLFEASKWPDLSDSKYSHCWNLSITYSLTCTYLHSLAAEQIRKTLLQNKLWKYQSWRFGNWFSPHQSLSVYISRILTKNTDFFTSSLNLSGRDLFTELWSSAGTIIINWIHNRVQQCLFCFRTLHNCSSHHVSYRVHSQRGCAVQHTSFPSNNPPSFLQHFSITLQGTSISLHTSLQNEESKALDSQCSSICAVIPHSYCLMA